MTESIFAAEYADRRANVPKGLPLIVALAGLSDAGGAVSQLDEYLWEQYQPEEVLRFNSDLLLDYRARRPVITFDQDHLTDYAPEELVLSVATDSVGKPFLILSGYEPDFRWDLFIDTVLMLVHEFEVSTTVWSHALPMPVPHTRPIRSTISGSRDDLIADRSAWKPRTKLSASAAHVLEYRLNSLGEEVVGIALLVPHYLANTEYPSVLLAELEIIMAATGLLLTVDEVRVSAAEFIRQVDAQISENEESEEMVRTLESRYDAFVAEEHPEESLMSEYGSLPTADQLASEFERFLAERRSDQGDDGKVGSGTESSDDSGVSDGSVAPDASGSSEVTDASDELPDDTV